ncbi:MAG TPA: cupredoxin domain-containing protein [Sphingomicrobium sp.]|nr:cupredoxin domain-containing protein [Sphingomicrobium sp.]
MRFGALPVALAVLLLSTPPAAAAPRTHVVMIDKMKFGPAPKAVRAGDRIVWVNKDMFRHTATSRAGGFDLDLPAGAKGAVVVGKTGTLAVVCRYHAGMRMTLQVAR